ncbi:ABC transporter ATP-binding protein [Ruminiclostridium herbifermentans]|uniref:ABC transporter ATP-binding protein n=1 Tax=Ruminiclostridium herbifermentans TaxID=2488810 RepID=A0A4U7JIP3_9FIRM|nr:ABC transporter ATP-binding protein [Ruminiclostridium herbifermentans]QNU67069.1 ABC transporter ATP-binding protein [Ruminiclostridium herbifermentans]
MIQIDKISKSYKKDKLAVDCLSMEVKSGEIFGFLGPNGAGKTTTIKILTGIISPDQGNVIINGFDMKKDPYKAKASFGYVPDEVTIYPKISGQEWLNFISTVYNVPKGESNKRIAELANQFEMSEVLNNAIGTYSHGMKQKIATMAALLYRPKVLILDEPMRGLDPKASIIFKEMMKEYAKQGNTVFFSTHILEVAEKICDRVAIINNGDLKIVIETSKIREKSDLENLFMELTEK